MNGGERPERNAGGPLPLPAPGAPFYALADLSSDAILVNAGERIVFANAAAVALFGATVAADLIGRTPFGLIEPEYHAVVRQRIQQILESGLAAPPIEERWRRLDGSQLNLVVTAAPVEWSEARAVQVVMQDVGERKRAEAALRQDELRFRTIAELVPDLLWSDDPNGAGRWCNRSWLDYTGQTLEEAQAYGWLAAIHPDDRERSLRNYLDAVDAGAPLRMEHRVRRSDGAYRWFLVQVRPVRDEDGHVVQWLGAATDVHDEKTRHQVDRAAYRLAEQARRKAERRNSSQERFVAMVSHDLRGSLGAVAGLAELLSSEVVGPMPEKQREFLSRIRENVRQMSALLEDLLSYARAGSAEAIVRIDDVDVVGLAREVVDLFAADAGARGLELCLRVPDGRYDASTDGGKVRQIVVNLVGNAVRYADRGPIEVELYPGEDGFELRVRDSGPGIPADRLEDIFEPFVQLNPMHPRARSGTGLGLAISRRLARLLGGDVIAGSGEGLGSTFTLSLPRRPALAGGSGA